MTKPASLVTTCATRQCWYDVFVHTPTGTRTSCTPAARYRYGETIANKRGVILSTDAGVSGTDMTFDGTDALHPNGLHPDQHDIVTDPNNPFQFFEANDGGVMRSSGRFVDRSAWCDDPRRGLSGAAARPGASRCCRGSRTGSTGSTRPLDTAVHEPVGQPAQQQMLQGGTQDNGTWENKGKPTSG